MAPKRSCCIPFSCCCFSSSSSLDEKGQHHPATSAGARSSPSATDNYTIETLPGAPKSIEAPIPGSSQSQSPMKYEIEDVDHVNLNVSGTHQCDKVPVSESLNILRKSEGKYVNVNLNVPGAPQCNEGSSSRSSNVPMKCEGEDVDVNLRVSGATRCDEAPSSGSPNVPVDANLIVSGAPSCNEASSSSSSRAATTSSSSRGATKSDHVINTILHKDIEEVYGKKVAVNLDDLMEHISELLKLREEEMLLDRRLPNPSSFPWPDVRGLKKLKDILSWGTDLKNLKELLSSGLEVASELKDNISGPITTVLKDIGQASVATAGLLVVAYTLERFHDVSTNKEKCWDLIKEMSYVGSVVQRLNDSPKGTQENVIEEATALVVEGAIICCTQIARSAWKSFFTASKNKDDLNGIREKLNVKYMQINIEIGFRVLTAIEGKGRSPLSKRYPTHAVGMDEPIKEVLRLLEIESDKNAVTVILHGFGGMGKTTLADAVFSNVGGCKYSKVRLFKDINSTPVIEELQKQILEDLMEPGETIPEIRTHEDGRRELEGVLGKIDAFIYVDNVLEGDALKKLLPQDMTRAKKVRFLLTARDENVKNECPRSCAKPKIYKMEGLQDQEAMLILGKEIEDRILDATQLNEIIQICGKIPLMLTLAAQSIGRADDGQEAYSTLMRQKDKWASEEFKEMRYAFAYDALPHDCRDPFLDICSYFKGWDWHTVEDIVGKDELKKLENRALVTRTQNGVASVHDVILKLAQQMSKEESKGKQVRLSFTSARELMAYLEEEKEGAAEEIKGIWLSDNNDVLQISASTLDSMHKSLRVLQLGSLTEVEGNCSQIFEELVFFEAKVPQLPFLDVSKLKQLRYLSYAPNEWKLSKMPSSLGHMEFTGCRELRELCNDFHCLSSLQQLHLTNCQRLEKLPGRFGQLKSLRVLDMRGCTALQKLPEGFGQLTNLERLDLEGCRELRELCNDFHCLSSLQQLDLTSCQRLEKLPPDFHLLTSLQKLYLFRNKLERFPETDRSLNISIA